MDVYTEYVDETARVYIPYYGEGIKTYTIGLIFLYFVAITSTLARLYHRWQRQQLYWDDFWASVALFGAVSLLIALIASAKVKVPMENLRLESFMGWIVFPLNALTGWAGRLCIGVTIVRILPPGRTRFITVVGNYIIVLLFFVVLLLKLFVCGVPLPRLPICKFSRMTPIMGFAMNIIASFWLLLWPGYIFVSHRYRLARLTKVKLPSTHHRLLLACFSTSLLLLTADIVHNSYFFKNDNFHLRVTGHIYCGLSVFLCNILVLVTSIYRLLTDPSQRSQSSGSMSHGQNSSNNNPFPLTSLARHGTTAHSQVDKVKILTETQTYTVVSGPNGKMAMAIGGGDRDPDSDNEKGDDILPRPVPINHHSLRGSKV